MPAAENTVLSHDVLVVGEALVDVVLQDGGTREHPGGSPANVAYGLARLGLDTTLLTALGEDAHGALIREHLSGAGVGLAPVEAPLERTASATAVLAPDGSAEYEFDIRWEPAPVLPLPPARAIHTGSIAAFLAPGAATVRSILEVAPAGTVITYDPNIRPALLGTHAEALAAFEELAPLAHVVKLSDEDAAWLYPGRGLDDVAARIIELGARLGVVTLGAGGSLLRSADRELRVPAVASQVVDTIGAGDSYMAALIAGVLETGTEELGAAELARLGSLAAAAAALTVRRAGANPPTRTELDGLLAGEG
ncbi:carbohydrate kinase family protein [Zafaria sp. J156]|uniref:carbohydrate kinase family protein n=1 Tax=Zafaria sp. J156 TaxID=3116490 RepID=UPI002E76CA52|nr:carbohydrate kinase [Zafaria sp. J156]MEE1622399.1 carbohydrate kinase [Zafaria sp. J156]